MSGTVAAPGVTTSAGVSASIRCESALIVTETDSLGCHSANSSTVLSQDIDAFGPGIKVVNVTGCIAVIGADAESEEPLHEGAFSMAWADPPILDAPWIVLPSTPTRASKSLTFGCLKTYWITPIWSRLHRVSLGSAQHLEPLEVVGWEIKSKSTGISPRSAHPDGCIVEVVRHRGAWVSG